MAATKDQIEDLYRCRYVAFRNMLATTTGSYESARDVVQDAFAQALRQRADFRGEASLEAWVWRIAFRLAIGSRAREARHNGPFPALDPGFVGPERDPELDAAVRSLPPRRRLIVFLRYFADLSYTEIGEVCAISEGTVAATLAQARAELLAALEPEGVPK